MKLIAALFVLLFTVNSRVQAAIFINRIEFAKYPEHYFLEDPKWNVSTNQPSFLLVNSNSTLHFSDGSFLGLAAGIEIGVAGQPTGVSVGNPVITYSFDRIPTNEPVKPNWFYYTQKFNNDAYFIELTYDNPIRIITETGSSVAIWEGWAKISSYGSIYGHTSGSNVTGLAPAGSLVPFKMNYELIDGTTWTGDQFSRNFIYRTTGTVDLTTWIVPEPGSPALAAGAILLTFGRRRGRL